jgi:hypothetical protein
MCTLLRSTGNALRRAGLVAQNHVLKPLTNTTTIFAFLGTMYHGAENGQLRVTPRSNKGLSRIAQGRSLSSGRRTPKVGSVDVRVMSAFRLNAQGSEGYSVRGRNREETHPYKTPIAWAKEFLFVERVLARGTAVRAQIYAYRDSVRFWKIGVIRIVFQPFMGRWNLPSSFTIGTDAATLDNAIVYVSHGPWGTVVKIVAELSGTTAYVHVHLEVLEDPATGKFKT